MDSVKPQFESTAVNDNHSKLQQQSGNVVNGYIVYTRRKRILHSHNGISKRLKTSEDGERSSGNVEIEVENGGVFGESGSDKVEVKVNGEVVPNDVVIRTLKVESENDNNSKTIIVVNKKPMTVKELFDTGLLDGVPVVYVGCKKAQTSGLRGVIKDGGILCSCCICNGHTVIPPSQFEIHACNTYKRAAQYICLENGKSLLDLLRACRAAPLHTLEATIQNFVSSLPEEKYFTCKSCKGCFPSSSVERVGPLCRSCMESRKSEESSIPAVGKRVRSPRPVSFPSTSELYISSQAKRHWKKRTMSSKLSVKSKTAPITSNSKCLSPKNKSHWRITKKHQLLHKLIFEENGLPDGAEVAYCARGQKLLEGIKRRSGILCRCCNTEISPSQFEVHAGWASRQKPERSMMLNAHAVAAGRVEGVDPMELIAKRCIRIVRDTEAEISGCALCRGSDFSISGFGPRTIIFCDQCEKEYHVGCLRDHKMAYLKELPEGNWLCCNDCTRIHSTLENLLVRGDEKLPESLLDVIKKMREESCLEPFNEIDVRWKLLNGKFASSETRPLLLEAVSMFHECFDPIIDAATGRDLVPSMVYGRNVQTQDFGGMYCALLMVNSSVVSAGMLRIFGGDIAELPLVATSFKNRGKGYFQTLFSCIERLLAFLNVKNLVLPASEEAESIWINKFGFRKMEPDQLTIYRRNCSQMMAFKGTIMLHKAVPPCRVINTQS